VKVRDRLKRRAYSRHALLRTWDVEVLRDVRRQIQEFMDRRGRCPTMDELLQRITCPSLIGNAVVDGPDLMAEGDV
jgi:hypothetical protein